MEDFDNYCYAIQNTHFQFLEGKEYDLLCHKELKHFNRILSNFIQNKEKAYELSKKIAPSGNLFYRIILVNCCCDEKLFTVPVICIRTNNDDVFYDIHCRSYQSWEDFLLNNQLPKCKMKFPANGIYKMNDGKLMLKERESPACNILTKVHKTLYTVAKIVSVIAPFLAGLNQLKPYNKAIAWASGISNTYTSLHHGYQLYDRKMHGQSISDSEAGAHWMHIGSNVTLFAVTVGSIKWGSPQSQERILQNVFSICKAVGQGESCISSLQKIQSTILCEHLCYFSNQAVEFYQKELIPSSIDLGELIVNVKRFCLRDNLVGNKLRRFVEIDGGTISTVACDMAFSKEIPKLFNTKLYSLTIELTKVVDRIMSEIRSWADGKATVKQSMFRVSEICRDSKSYETIEEMCKYFNVTEPKNIVFNNKELFSGSREKFLEFFEKSRSENFPQLLLYIVEYLKSHDNDDIDALKTYLRKKVHADLDEQKSLQASSTEREWMNALNLENLNYAWSVSQEGIQLAKLRTGNDKEVTLGDLYILAKKLLGRVGSVEFKLVVPDVKWVVVAVRRGESGLVLIVAPRMSLNGTGIFYPVFKRPF